MQRYASLMQVLFLKLHVLPNCSASVIDPWERSSSTYVCNKLAAFTRDGDCVVLKDSAAWGSSLCWCRCRNRLLLINSCYTCRYNFLHLFSWTTWSSLSIVANTPLLCSPNRVIRLQLNSHFQIFIGVSKPPQRHSSWIWQLQCLPGRWNIFNNPRKPKSH